MKFYLLVNWILLLISICLASIPTSLYSKTDPLWILDNSNFNEVVLGRENAWIIEFYNNWCGHCIRFAPVWKKFASDTSTWKKVIDVGVVNCNDPENVKLCRQYEVTSFPTIKLFWHHTNESDLGEVLTGDRDIPSIENQAIDFLTSNWQKGVPKNWPEFQPAQMESVTSMTQAMPHPKSPFLLLIENPDSYIGRQVILDLSFRPDIFIGRVLTSNAKLLSDLNFQTTNDTALALVKIFPNKQEEPPYKFSDKHDAADIRDQIFKELTGVSRNQTKSKDEQSQTSTVAPVINGVYMIDLENAVYSLLSQEVGVTKVIDGEKLSALKAFLSVLKTYFPGNPHVVGYLSNLYNWVSYKKHSIAGEEFVQAMDQIQTENEYLPKMREWIGCKGSEPRFRGYPCSLWTLFHTLTVQADNASAAQENIANEHSGEVLFIIRDYVQHFFTCQECSAHFLEMAENVEKDVETSKAAVLWLWDAHNKVNKRLAGDITEDPQHPKIQFPAANQCQKCRVENTNSEEVVWNRPVVLEYLHSFYGKSNILRKDNGRIRFPISANQNNAAMVNTFKNDSINKERLSFQGFTKTDFRLCVFLYSLSVFLLVVLLFLFRQRRRRRKSHAGKYLQFFS